MAMSKPATVATRPELPEWARGFPRRPRRMVLGLIALGWTPTAIDSATGTEAYERWVERDRRGWEPTTEEEVIVAHLNNWRYFYDPSFQPFPAENPWRARVACGECDLHGRSAWLARVHFGPDSLRAAGSFLSLYETFARTERRDLRMTKRYMKANCLPEMLDEAIARDAALQAEFSRSLHGSVLERKAAPRRSWYTWRDSEDWLAFEGFPPGGEPAVFFCERCGARPRVGAKVLLKACLRARDLGSEVVVVGADGSCEPDIVGTLGTRRRPTAAETDRQTARQTARLRGANSGTGRDAAGNHTPSDLR